MITLFDGSLEFITPAFLAGADQSRAELRVPAIRAQLRWWFRALGGTLAEETALFGGVHGGKPVASRVRIRAAIAKRGPQWIPPRVTPNSPSAYVWHFAKASANGARWSSSGVLPPGTQWRLLVTWSGPNAETVPPRLTASLRAFLALGAVGLRAGRGLGAFDAGPEWRQLDDSTRDALAASGFLFEDKGEIADVDGAVSLIGDLVKGTRKTQGWINDIKHHTETPSPMGSSNDPRQASAIRFRPVRTSNNRLRIVVYEAPHERVLGSRSQKQPIVGKTPSRIVLPPPRD